MMESIERKEGEEMPEQTMIDYVEREIKEGADRVRLLALGERLLRGEVVVDDQD